MTHKMGRNSYLRNTTVLCMASLNIFINLRTIGAFHLKIAIPYYYYYYYYYYHHHYHHHHHLYVGIYNYISETNHVSRAHSSVAIL